MYKADSIKHVFKHVQEAPQPYVDLPECIIVSTRFVILNVKNIRDF